ncbi:MAG: RloB domain-containing protein [Bacteroidales bacterium]|nr:RloB domain-containing protein [Bacteroidales bacterium]
MARRKLAPEKTQKFFKKGKGSFAQRNEGTREMNPLTPFVISGGERTERFYFKHISDVTEYKFNIKPKYFGKESNFVVDFPKRISEILKTNSDAKIFCVFDYDTIFNSETNRKNYETFKTKIAKEIKNGSIILCPSMPCIEYWFLLHFTNYKQLIPTCEDVDKKLEPFMKSYFSEIKMDFIDILKSEKHLKDPSWVANLCADGKLEKAITRAEDNINKATAENDLENQSYSYVYRLFKP